MSNIYIQEPPTNGKVLLVTSCGDIDIELWSKETPKACRNFIQLCMEGYYDNTIFHRVVKEFIVQGGDPTGSGHGGESIYDRPFKDEFHQRLRFVRRGLVAMANAGPNDNGSQFFFTMSQTPELQNKHTIFGKVSGNTVYNMLKLQECETDADDRPVYPNKIVKTQILANPYDDIIPRQIKKTKKDEGDIKPKSKSRATKNFKLLSFGEEAEEDEEFDKKITQNWRGKGKSSHDLTNDPKLSARPAVDVSPGSTPPGKHPLDPADLESEDEQQLEERREAIKKKLKKELMEEMDTEPVEEPRRSTPPAPEHKSPAKKPSSRSEELREEAKQLKREIRDSKKRSEQRKAEAAAPAEEKKEEETPASNDPLADFKKERLKYKAMRKKQGKKGVNREEITLGLLAKFKSKLSSVHTMTGNYSDDEEKNDDNDDDDERDDESDMTWMNHKLRFEEQQKSKVIDANIHDVDRYEIHDPRNPLTKRRREESKQKMKAKR